MVKKWRQGYKQSARCVPFRWANSVTTPPISSSLCLCAELQESSISRICKAFDRSQKKKSNFVGFLGTNLRKNRPISRKFCASFPGKLHQKAIGKKWPILWLFSRQISLEINWFSADQTSVFYVFLTEVIICSFNNNMLQKWTNGKTFNITASAQFFAS